MGREQNLSKRLHLLLLIICLGFLGCVKLELENSTKTEEPSTTTGQQFVGQQVPGEVKELHFCEQEANRGTEGCKLVLAGFSGTFKWFNLPTLQGDFRSNFYPDGKLKTMALFPSAQTDKPPWVEHNFTYLSTGEIQTHETFSDTNFDGTYDLKNTLNYHYNPNTKKLQAITGVSTPPDEPGNILNKMMNMNLDNQTIPGLAPNQIFNSVQFQDGNQNPTSGSTEIRDLDSEGKITKSISINGPYPPGVPQSIEWVGEQKTFTFEGGKPTSLTHYFYFCPNQSGGVCLVPLPNPLPPNTPPIIFQPNLIPYLKIETTWQYPEGKLKTIEAKIDGDFDANGPKAGVDGVIDATMTCGMDHFPDSGNVIAAFPKEMEHLGLSASDQIKSAHCHDNGLGLVDVNLEFTDWRYLRDVTGNGTGSP